ncbi:hypothetical protein [Flavobacterium sp.]|uniref:hypothetical protein n=1 Tax=Flavobacterium sp. TaxID=239 RepID=UPI0039E68ED9
MLEEKIIYAPNKLIFEDTIKFVNSFCRIWGKKKYIFDFKNTTTLDTFSLLYVSYKLEVFKKNNPTSEFHARNIKHLTYPAHMGFFKSFGANFGKNPGEAAGSRTYSPIKIFKISEIKQTARDSGIHYAEYLEQLAEEISNILTQNKSETVTDILKYSIREILRNIVEHSEGDEFSFCAQYIPSLGKVYFAVLDKGIGLKKALSSNPKLSLLDDMDAIRWGLKPGVSGKVYPGQKRKPKGDWANSGYGLYMTSNICKQGSSTFFICSGESGLLISKTGEQELKLEMEGTAVYLGIDIHKIKELKVMLKKFGDNVPKDIFIQPSKSSMNIASKSKNA